MRTLKLSLCAALALASVLLPLGARAQTVAVIDRLEVGIWPEYDRPSVLYLYAIQLAPGTKLPASFSLSIPAASGEPLAVAKLGPDGKLYDAQYTRQVQGDWASITVQTDSLTNRMEYYGSLNIQGQTRTLVWTWQGGPAVGDLSFKVQQPIGATGLSVTPGSSQTTTESDGLTYYSGDLGPVAASSASQIEVTYNRSTSELTASLLPTGVPASSEPPISPAAAAKSALPSLNSLVPWVLGAVGVVLLALGGFMVVQMRRSAVAPTRSRRRNRTAAAKPESGAIEASPMFCHSCGSKADASDLYCRRCGTRLRHQP
jgi:hypothetical protein